MNLGEALRGRNNALNAIRLVCAALVVVSHSFPLTGLVEPTVAGLTLGTWAVATFFAISGYLIPASRMRQPWRRYLANRTARIFPALWASLIIVAALFAPAAALITGTPYDPTSATSWVLNNAITQMGQVTIGQSLQHLPFQDWNGSIHTLAPELGCYAVAGALLSIPALRRQQLPTAVAVLAASTIGRDHLAPWLMSFFAAGWIIATQRERIPTTAWVPAAAAAALALTSQVAPFAMPLPLALLALSLGAVLPTRAFAVNDISYGTYLYAWPIQQLLELLGVAEVGSLATGYLLHVTLSLIGAITLGTASWFLLERRCLPKRQHVAAAEPPLGSVTQPA